MEPLLLKLGATYRWGLSGTPPLGSAETAAEVSELFWYPGDLRATTMQHYLAKVRGCVFCDLLEVLVCVDLACCLVVCMLFFVFVVVVVVFRCAVVVLSFSSSSSVVVRGSFFGFCVCLRGRLARVIFHSCVFPCRCCCILFFVY